MTKRFLGQEDTSDPIGQEMEREERGERREEREENELLPSKSLGDLSSVQTPE